MLGPAIVGASLVAGGSALGADRAVLPAPSVTAISNARAVAVLHQAQRTLAGDGNQDATLVLSRLAIVLPRLTGAQAAQAEALLARPTSKPDPQHNEYKVAEHRLPLCTAHFCTHWVDTTVDAPNPKDANANGIPDFVERVAFIMEAAYQVENNRLGWAPPKPDGKHGGNPKTDVYLAQIGDKGLFGYAAPDPGQGKPHRLPPRSEYSYLVLDQNFSRKEFQAPPNESLAVTIAHEYNHILQFNYDLFQDGWAKEATATWMEDRVFPQINDYLRYMHPWVGRTKVPLTFFTNAKVYGSAVWNHWLAARYGPDVVLDTWRRAQKVRPAGFSVDAYSSAIRAAGSSNFERDFARFALDTAEWNVNGRFPEGFRYPDVKRAGTLTSGQRTTRKLSHTGYQLINIHVPKRARSLRLGVNVARGTRSAIGLVGRLGKGKNARTVTRQRFLRGGGQRSVALGLPGRYSRITAVIVNSDTRQAGFSGPRQDWRYTRDNVAFKLGVHANR